MHETLPATSLNINDPSKFEVLHDVPVFDEHDADEPEFDGEGNYLGTRKVTYSKEILEAIAENMNHRIRDTGDYTAICAGHTPTPEEERKGAKPPPVIGYAGPYYVAKLGAEKPRHFIVAKDWAIFREKVQEAKGLPRRSIEMFCGDDPKSRYFDPIAVLGATTPRRALGLTTYRRHNERHVQRYSMAAPAFASGSNTFIPCADDDKRRDSIQETPAMALAPEDIQQIVAAVMETAPMQWVTQQMEAENPKGSPTDEVPAAGAAPVPDPNAQYEEAEKEVPAVTMEEKPKLREDESPADEPEQEKERYRMAEVEKIRYAQLEAQFKSLTAKYSELEKRQSATEQSNRQKLRYSQLEALAHEHVLDIEAETKRAEKLSDDAWEDHVGIIKAHYQKIPVGTSFLPVEAPRKAPAGEAEMHEEAKRRALRYQNDGKRVRYQDVFEEVKAERNGHAKAAA